MIPKPAHLTRDNAARFQSQSVVDLYHLRLPYPPEVFETLLGLITDEPRAVLDVGTGTGELARALVGHADRVDAVDVSAAMIAKGRMLSGGDHPCLRWIEGRIEDVPLQPPYALITAGDSLHWMDWETVFARFGAALTAHGFVAIVHRTELDPPWQDDLLELVRRYSTMQNYQPFDLIAELEQRHLFQSVGRWDSLPVVSHRPVEDYIASFHSCSSLSRDHMAASDAAAFDQGLRETVRPWSTDELLELRTVGGIVWGVPVPG